MHHSVLPNEVAHFFLPLCNCFACVYYCLLFFVYMCILKLHNVKCMILSLTCEMTHLSQHIYACVLLCWHIMSIIFYFMVCKFLSTTTTTCMYVMYFKYMYACIISVISGSEVESRFCPSLLKDFPSIHPSAYLQ